MMSVDRQLLKLIEHIDYHHFKQIVDKLHETTGHSRIWLFNDMVYCGLKYQAGYNDYMYLEMYDMNNTQRASMITRGINNAIVVKYNDRSQVKWLDNKDLLYEKFNDLLGRHWLKIDGTNYAEFAEVFKDDAQIVIKPIVGTHGQDVARIELKGNREEIYKRITANGPLLAESVLKQCTTLNKLHPQSVNDIRLVTFKGKVLVAYLRIGTGKNVVDNFNHDGLMAPIDEKDGIIRYPAIQKGGKTYTRHPDTDEPIVGLRIPHWDRICQLGQQAAQRLPEVGYIGWDICDGEDRACLIEGNDFPGHDIYQLPVHCPDRIGFKDKFRAAGIEIN